MGYLKRIPKGFPMSSTHCSVSLRTPHYRQGGQMIMTMTLSMMRMMTMTVLMMVMIVMISMRVLAFNQGDADVIVDFMTKIVTRLIKCNFFNLSQCLLN